MPTIVHSYRCDVCGKRYYGTGDAEAYNRALKCERGIKTYSITLGFKFFMKYYREKILCVEITNSMIIDGVKRYLVEIIDSKTPLRWMSRSEILKELNTVKQG
ncbi:hypothetical protein A2V49_01315 [candidate division WWE3 bacterium RBG_19FT_COMBO_34_6]|uniref:Uncharacterized protein n=1 Tax=candidate division WWE3 bacterium RBG_19FT_COMBO_34_6 TaxID=1802612 RepID=A0A1F4UJS9_UNCKA|nr:MAG: hypothetical protein A2V49_01315 [candidate division WWE3 bacterium RBG_19FT_COMBO_34_6]